MNDLIAQAEALEAQAKELRRQAAAEKPREIRLVSGYNAIDAINPGIFREVHPVRVTDEMKKAAFSRFYATNTNGQGVNAVIEYTIRGICGLEVADD